MDKAKGKGRRMPVENMAEMGAWEKLYEQTPTILRYVIGVLSLGIVTMITTYWRWSRKQIREELSRVEQKIDQTDAARREEIGELHRRIDHSDWILTQRLDEVNTHLIQIASNTNRSQRNDES